MLDTGDPITADQARKLACEAGIIPMVLGGKSEVLDLGRRKRLYTSTSGSRSGTATSTAPPSAATGPPRCATSTTTCPGAGAARPTVADGRLLCPRHHSYAHSPKYEMKTIPNGRVVFSRS